MVTTSCSLSDQTSFTVKMFRAITVSFFFFLQQHVSTVETLMAAIMKERL